MVLIKAACVFHQGFYKTMQEDNFLFDKQIMKNAENGSFTNTFKNSSNICMAVFDGLGGLPDGEKASELAANTLKHQIEDLKLLREIDSSWMSSAILTINRSVAMLGEQGGHACGTTAAILLIDKQKIYVGNVGDSRIYQFMENSLSQISVDHSDRDLIKELGIADRKPSLLQYIGIHPKVGKIFPSVCCFEHKNKGRYIICTDGLTDMVCDTDIEAICRESKTAEECSKKLVQRALDNGGADNVTVIVCDFVESLPFPKLINYLKNRKGDNA